jgi:hypothetical protein
MGIVTVVKLVLLPLRIISRSLTNVQGWYDDTIEHVSKIEGAGRELKSAELDGEEFDNKLEGKSGKLRAQVKTAPMGVSGEVKDDVHDLARYCERGMNLLPDLYESKSFSETIEIYLQFLDRIDREGRYWSKSIFADVSPSDVREIDLERVMRRSNLLDEDVVSELGEILEDCEAVKDNKIPKERFKEQPIDSLFEHTNLTWNELSSEIPWEKMDDVVDERSRRRFKKELTRELVTVYFIDKPDELIDMMDEESISILRTLR